MKHDKTFHPLSAITRRDFLAGMALLGVAGAVRGWAAPLPAAGLDHLNIHVPNVVRSADFYIKLFGGVHVSRSPNAKAQTPNPDSPSGVLWFVRLGENSLAISPTRPQQNPGIDHICFAIAGYDGVAMKGQLAGLNHQWPDAPPNNLWVRDADGYVIQLTRGADPSRVPGSGVGAVLVEPPGGVPRQPAFRATRIAQLTLAVPAPNSSASYYRMLLGDAAETQPNAQSPQSRRFRVGPSELILGPASGGESFRVSVAGFNPAAAVSTLQGLGVAAAATPDRNAVSFRDPDGIHVEISG